MTPLERARLVAARYPIAVRRHGGCTVDGVAYIWDPVRNNLYTADGLKAEVEAEKEKRRAAIAQLKMRQTELRPPSMLEVITSQGWKMEMSDDRLVLHHKKSDELREFRSIEEAFESVRADMLGAK